MIRKPHRAVSASLWMRTGNRRLPLFPPASIGPICQHPNMLDWLLMSAHCAPCVAFSQRLASVDLGGWSLVAIIREAPSALGETQLSLPASAQRVHDAERRLFQLLGCIATPTALAFVDGRLVGQQASPTIAWFRAQESGGSRPARGGGVVLRPEGMA